jgi:DNA-binding NarL/FixJ family response regulator
MDFTPRLDQARQTNLRIAELLADRSLMAVSGQRVLLALLTTLTGETGRWAGAVTTEREAVSLLDERRPDLLFVTDPLEEGSGIELVRTAKTRHPDLPCLLLLKDDSPDVVRAALEAGCDGICVDRRVGLGHLLAATRAVLGGGAYMDGPVVVVLRQTSRGRGSGTPGALTPRELEVLEEVVRGSTNEEIARKLFVSEETVRTHIKAVIRKLNARNRTHAAVIALGLELVRWEWPGDHLRRQ